MADFYDATIPVFLQFLGNLDKIIDKARAHADVKKFDAEVFFGLRLAPDMYAFSSQVQAACDAAKYCAAKLTGKEPPSNPDTEKNLDELKARIKTTRDYLETFTRADFAGCEDRRVRHAWMPQGISIRGGDYLDYFALPNFHFHLTTAYGLLRSNGVELSKMDYMAGLPMGPG